ncbi:MAG: hypothetical protein PWP65_462 [Clostridia bacterium]|nr:hypothetical protein [Clostridia bacterium]
MENLNLKECAARIIGERVSIRKYQPVKVKREDLLQVLEAGRRAPSGENAQPWRFIVVEDEITKKKLGRIARQGSGRRFVGEFVAGILEERFKTVTDPQKKQQLYRNLMSGDVSAFIAEASLSDHMGRLI